ncbi:hypothetical protein BsWGS_14176 [Bradybaena similaris]
MTSVLWRRYQHYLQKYPLGTMASTTGSLMAAGDCISQLVIERKPLASYDGIRTGRFFVMGFCIFGPMLRGWYLTLDRLYSGKKYAALKMMVTDQLVMAPLFLGTFLTGMSMLRMESLDITVEKLKRDYVPILLNNYKIWPAAQVINFYFLPLQHRVLFVNFVALWWNTYLAWASEKE